MNPAPINRIVETRVGSIALADQGAGAPVVLWPSVFSDHRLYDLVVRHLGEEWRPIRVDGPGFGQSEARPDRGAPRSFDPKAAAVTARIVIVPSCGHLAPLKAPEAVVAALNALVK